MCDGKIGKASSSHRATATTKHQNPLVMTNLKSYESPTGKPPRKASAFVTGLLFLIFLILSEQSLRVLFFNLQHLHPILENETNRFILARHVGVDFLSCFIVAALGWNSREIAHDLVRATVGGSSKSAAMTPAGMEQRMFTYHPASFRIALFFWVFQLKNLYDTIVWNDGPGTDITSVVILAKDGLCTYVDSHTPFSPFTPYYFTKTSRIHFSSCSKYDCWMGCLVSKFCTLLRHFLFGIQ